MGLIKNILLTGSSGFLGSFILRKLIASGFKPILLLRESSDLWRIDKYIKDCIVYKGLETEEEYEELFNRYNIDCIIHLATDYGRDKSMSKLLETNLLLPLSLIEKGSKKGLKLFINTDSFFAKKKYNQDYLRNYTISKRLLEKALILLKGDVDIINMRIEHVYGENDSNEKFFAAIIKKLLNNESYIELTKGEQKRDFIYAEDVASAYLTVVEKIQLTRAYREFQVGTGESIKLKDFLNKIAIACGTETELRFGALPMRKGDVSDSYADNTPLIDLGWKINFTIEEAINQIIKIEKERFKL